MQNTMIDFVNMASTSCMLTVYVLNASIFTHWYTLFVVQVVKYAASATYMQTVRSRHVFIKDDKTDGTMIVAFIHDPSKCHFVF